LKEIKSITYIWFEDVKKLPGEREKMNFFMVSGANNFFCLFYLLYSQRFFCRRCQALTLYPVYLKKAHRII